MPFSDEEKKELSEIIAAALAANQPKASESTPASSSTAATEDEKQEKSLAEQARAFAASKENEEAATSKLEDAIVFTNSIDRFVKDNESALPESAKNILDIANSKSYGSRIEKANHLRKSLIEEYIAIEDNVKDLPATVKAKIEKFNKLTEDAKLKKSAAFWEIVDIGVTNKTNAAKAAQLNMSNHANNNGGAFETRFFELGNRFKSN